MTNKEKYIRLLEFYDDKKFDHDETADILDRIITIVKQKGGIHQAGCAWAVALLIKHKKINTLQIEETINEFNDYCNGFSEYEQSVDGDYSTKQMTFYNYFLYKKKGS